MEKKSVLDLFAERNDGNKNRVCSGSSCPSDDSSSSRDAGKDSEKKLEASKDPLSLMDPNDALEIRKAGKVADIDLSALSGMWSNSGEVENDMSEFQIETKKGRKKKNE